MDSRRLDSIGLAVVGSLLLLFGARLSCYLVKRRIGLIL